MPPQPKAPPRVNGILETALYVQSAARSAEFYQRVFGFEIIDFAGDQLDDNTRLCALRAGDRDVLLLFKRGATPDTDALLAPFARGSVCSSGCSPTASGQRIRK